MTTAETEARTRDIKAIAKKVYNISFDYHLVHAVFGSDGLLFINRKENYKDQLIEINKKLQAAKRENNTGLETELKAEAEELLRNIKKRKYYILVDYVALNDLDGGRVVNLDNNLHIQLSQKLTENIREKAAGELQKETVENIQNIMAHELGHIVLHAEQLPSSNLQGSYNETLKDVDWEAQVFATELLHLYRKKDR